MNIEINKEEIKYLESTLIDNLSIGYNDGDYDQFLFEAGNVMTKKQFEKKIKRVKELLNKLKELKNG